VISLNDNRFKKLNTCIQAYFGSFEWLRLPEASIVKSELSHSGKNYMFTFPFLTFG